ncbi:MAG: fibronectin type III domain-containing protein, partial [Oscillospiraceae bacterium]|nr:fibronectin type III domain-containing protein [Oscillospiraceae bacterium]
TIGANAAPGTATIRAAHGTLVANASLTVSRADFPVPTSFRTVDVGTRAITVAWFHPAGTGVTGFNVRVHQEDQQHPVTFLVTAPASNFVITNLIPNTAYLISVQAVRPNDQTSAFTDALHVRTAEEFRVRFFANEGIGTVPGNIYFTANQNIRFPDRGPLSRPGFIFQGWRENDHLGNPTGSLRAPNTQFNFGARNVDLHAQWQAAGPLPVHVNVFLYADTLLDPIFHESHRHSADVQRIAQDAAYSFYHTFNMRMNFQTGTTNHSSGRFWISSPKNDCDCAAVGGRPRMSRPEFLCPGLPRNSTFLHCHHSNVSAMINSLSAQAGSAAGLHTMFFAGTLCSTRGGSHSSNVFGAANAIGGNLVVNTSSRHDMLPFRVLQHEWSHSYGAIDNYNDFEGMCTPRQSCIMRGNFVDTSEDLRNVWCSACRQVIRENQSNHSS